MTTQRKSDLGTDSEGRYRRSIGWKLASNNRLVQHLFRLGKDRQQALLANAKLEQLWQAVEARWQRLCRQGIVTTTSPLWDDTTLDIGRSIARGDTSCTLTPPPGMEQLGAENLVLWLNSLQADFPILVLKLPDNQKFQAGQAARQEEAQELEDLSTAYQSAARKLRGQSSTGTILQALQSYKEHIHRKYSAVGYGKFCGKLVKFLIDNTTDMPLANLTGDKITEWVEHYRRRPNGQRGRLAKNTCNNIIQRIRYFVTWLDASEEFTWELPKKFRFGKVRVESTSEELSARIRSDTVKRFTIEELAVLWQHALPFDRVLICLGLNCGYSRAEISTLMVDEVFLDHEHPRYKVVGNWIKRLRRKTRVYGEWLLWPVTVQAIEWLLRNRPETKCGNLVVNKQGQPMDSTTASGIDDSKVRCAWHGLLRQVKKKHPEFRPLSMRYLRKTGASLVRELKGGEVSSMYLSHGPTSDSDDKLLAVYAQRPFGKLHKTLRKLGQNLQEVVFSKVENPFPDAKVTRMLTGAGVVIGPGKTKRVKELLAQGYTVLKIVELTGVSATTVRRIRKGNT